MDETETDLTSDDRQARAGHLLAAFTERRRRRRGEDTWFGSTDLLLPPADTAEGEGERVRRRLDVLEEAQAEGMPAELAAMLYDVAREEGLDPALALELVRSGLGVLPPDEGLANASEQPTVDRYSPLWLTPPIPTDYLLRERMLRLSFRRVRGLLEQHHEAEEALRAFAREPDVGVFGY